MFLSREEYIKIKRTYSNKSTRQLKMDYEMYKLKKENYCIDPEYLPLAPLPKAECPCVHPTFYGECKHTVIKEEGKTPMRYNDNYASASVTSVSDAQIQREYLLNRLDRATSLKEAELYTLFNMGEDNTPKTFKELIDAIKNDKFSVDKKIEKRLKIVEEDKEYWYKGPLHGIIWEGKKPDWDGFNENMDTKNKQGTATKDIIMTDDATAGLKALQDFEAWLPTPAETTTSA